MAEFVMKDLVKKAGLTSQFQIASAATSREEIGNPVYPLARRKLAEHGIACGGHAARQFINSDYEKYDLLIGMDKAGISRLKLAFNMNDVCTISTIKMERGTSYPFARTMSFSLAVEF